mmetsp:Transcript_88546/g.237500  ORF Transcript_88546/g.237500 Transcript_88546/m.237500 type:complete len:301 (-) Transcript_88546:780-1682(-)
MENKDEAQASPGCCRPAEAGRCVGFAVKLGFALGYPDGISKELAVPGRAVLGGVVHVDAWRASILTSGPIFILFVATLAELTATQGGAAVLPRAGTSQDQVAGPRRPVLRRVARMDARRAGRHAARPVLVLRVALHAWITAAPAGPAVLPLARAAVAGRRRGPDGGDLRRRGRRRRGRGGRRRRRGARRGRRRGARSEGWGVCNQGGAHEGAGGSELGGGPAARAAGAGLQSRAGLALVRDRPIGVGDVVRLHEIQPPLCLDEVQGSIARSLAGPPFRHEESGAFSKGACRLVSKALPVC